MADGNHSDYFACDDVVAANDRFEEVLGAAASGSGVETAVAELTVVQQLERLAAALLDDHQAGNARAAIWIKNWHPKYVGQGVGTILAGAFSVEDAQLVMAKDHGFADWADVQARGQQTPDANFESAVDAVVHGDLAALQSLLAELPALATARSSYGHGATLLYYLAANGVEIRRQSSPYNAVEVAKALLHAAADPNATANSYGQPCTIVNALVTSGHPAESGTQADLLKVLLDAGAPVNGPKDDGSPISWALAFGQMEAAQVLSDRGARIPDLVSAAALGRRDLFESHVAENRTISPPFDSYKDPFGKQTTTPSEILGQSLLAASKAGHMELSQWLLAHGVSANFANQKGQTALHFAAYSGTRALAELLLANGADATQKDDQYGSTAATWAHVGGHEELSRWLEGIE